MQKISYIDNNMQLGIAYDWNLIIKTYLSLQCPKSVYSPVKILRNMSQNNIAWYIGMSKRNTGKTTNFLLIGMIMNWLYGTQIYYIRQRDEMIAPKHSKSMFDTILEFDYVSKITEGRYNSVLYRSKAWYMCTRDDNGNVVDESLTPFCNLQSITSANDVKSVINNPYADFIIYDEFINATYYNNEFVDFFNLISTLKRFRRSAKIILLANTIDMYHVYFQEFCIADNVQKMKAGETAVITTEIGTKIIVERIEQAATARAINDLDKIMYYGFPNPKLASITGDNWSIANYQHIPEGEYNTIFNKIYIFYNGKYAKLEIVSHETLELCIYVHWATRIYNDSIILTAEQRTDKRYKYKLGCGNVENTVRKMFLENKVYYASNEIGAFVTSYMSYIRRLQTW